MVATVDVVVHHINSSNTTAPTPARPMMQDPPAKFVTTRDTHPLSAGTGSMSLMAQITKVHVLFMAWTQIGMWILELLIMLLETQKSFPLMIVMVARIRSKQQMVQAWKSLTLVILLFKPVIVICILIISFMPPEARKNLVSVHRLALDNSAYLEFHPNFVLVKDQATKNTILRGPCHGGLYSLPSNSPLKQAFGVTRPSFERWHNRLGHPSRSIVSKVVSNYNLPCLDESNKESVCDACQQAKSHQLPYSKSFSESKYPLELVFSDVWGPVLDSVGGKNITSVLLMTLVNSHGFTSLNINQKCFKNS